MSIESDTSPQQTNWPECPLVIPSSVRLRYGLTFAILLFAFAACLIPIDPNVSQTTASILIALCLSFCAWALWAIWHVPPPLTIERDGLRFLRERQILPWDDITALKVGRSEPLGECLDIYVRPDCDYRLTVRPRWLRFLVWLQWDFLGYPLIRVFNTDMDLEQLRAMIEARAGRAFPH